MKHPLGRIHPHGSGGKSVYQRAGEEANGELCGFFDIILRGVGYILLGLCLVGLVGGLASSGSGEVGAFGLVLLGIAMALVNG